MSAESLLAEIDGLRSELAAARRVIQAVEAECAEMEATGVGLLYAWAHTIRAAVGGPGPTPEPASEPNAYELTLHPDGTVTTAPAWLPPGPTDDERPATEAQR